MHTPSGAIAIGARLFARKGYAATTTRELSKAMGITNGTFYHYYESKEDLLLKICEESLEESRTQLGQR
jgi:AcrR family transcriptional regulator